MPTYNNTTMTTDTINPVIYAPVVSAVFNEKLKFAALTNVVNLLEARKGMEITIPKYTRVEGPEKLVEGEPMGIAKLTQTKDTVRIEGYGKAGAFTDEDLMVDMGDPVEEFAKQQAAQGAILADSKIISALVEKRPATDDKPASAPYEIAINGTFGYNAIVDSLLKFGDRGFDDDVTFVMTSNTYAECLKDPIFAADARANAGLITDGRKTTVGGNAIHVTDQLTKVDPKIKFVALKGGAVNLYLKRAPKVEHDYDILTQAALITWTVYFGVHRAYDDRVLVGRSV